MVFHFQSILESMVDGTQLRMCGQPKFKVMATPSNKEHVRNATTVFYNRFNKAPINFSSRKFPATMRAGGQYVII